MSLAPVWSSLRWAALATLAGCAGHPADAFVGSFAYAAGSSAHIDCGGGMAFDVPFDTIVETFTLSGDGLSKADSQGCTGLEFSVEGDVASLSRAGQSCVIPAAGMNPQATFAPSSYVFTRSGDTLAQTLTASYTPQGGSACAVTATNTLHRK
jgi:hypothetical protein